MRNGPLTIKVPRVQNPSVWPTEPPVAQLTLTAQPSRTGLGGPTAAA